MPSLKKILLPLRILGSMYFAVGLILLLAVILAWATIMDQHYGMDASSWAIYSSNWFVTLFFLLGLSVLISTLTRFPWKRHQIGFVLTHLGILILLLGCWISLKNGSEASLGITEGDIGTLAYVKNAQHFSLNVFSDRKTALEKISEKKPGKVHLDIPFKPGPFSWQYYDKSRFFNFFPGETLPLFPWQTIKRTEGILYNQDGIKLEVLDYYAQARLEEVPGYQSAHVWQGTDSSGTPAEVIPLLPAAINQRPKARNGQTFIFRKAENDAHVQAFLQCTPDNNITEDLAQVTLWLNGTVFRIPFSHMKYMTWLEIPDAPWRIMLTSFSQEMGMIKIHVENMSSRENAHLMLMADAPEMNTQASSLNVYGYLWQSTSGLPEPSFPGHSKISDNEHSKTEKPQNVPPEESSQFQHAPSVPNKMDEPTRVEMLPAETENPSSSLATHAPVDLLAQRTPFTGGINRDPSEMMARMQKLLSAPRIEILEGTDGAIYVRAWKRPVFTLLGQIKENTDLTLFPSSDSVMRFQLMPKEKEDIPHYKLIPIKPGEKNIQKIHQPLISAARVKITVDKKTDEFWIPCRPTDPLFPAPNLENGECILLDGEKHTVSLTLENDTVDVGFRMRLDHFNKRLDPGVSTAARYSSDVTLLDPLDLNKILIPNVKIIINQPVDIQGNNTCWRVYQTSYRKLEPGDPLFSHALKLHPDRDQFYVSFFTVNYDPGRGYLYLGCFLLVTGIGVMFYMRTYFFGHGLHNSDTSQKNDTSLPKSNTFLPERNG